MFGTKLNKKINFQINGIFKKAKSNFKATDFDNYVKKNKEEIISILRHLYALRDKYYDEYNSIAYK